MSGPTPIYELVNAGNGHQFIESDISAPLSSNHALVELMGDRDDIVEAMFLFVSNLKETTVYVLNNQVSTKVQLLLQFSQPETFGAIEALARQQEKLIVDLQGSEPGKPLKTDRYENGYLCSQEQPDKRYKKSRKAQAAQLAFI